MSWRIRWTIVGSISAFASSNPSRSPTAYRSVLNPPRNSGRNPSSSPSFHGSRPCTRCGGTLLEPHTSTSSKKCWTSPETVYHRVWVTVRVLVTVFPWASRSVYVSSTW